MAARLRNPKYAAVTDPPDTPEMKSMRSIMDAPPPRTGVCASSSSTPKEKAAARVPPPEKGQRDQIVVSGGAFFEVFVQLAREIGAAARLVDRRILDRRATEQQCAQSEYGKY